MNINLGRVVRKESQLEPGCWYQIVGKTKGGQPIPAQVIYLLSKPEHISALGLPSVKCVFYMSLGADTIRVPPMHGDLLLKYVNVPENGEADIELRYLGSTPEQAQLALKRGREYKDIRQEKPK